MSAAPRWVLAFALQVSICALAMYLMPMPTLRRAIGAQRGEPNGLTA